ncbi:hypothetical protein AOXY_G27545 [Acipenser oxyrinchus oxyrinchus]|uniref:Ig-like domain-containing protein n=1 Tax=Acipenser oxyrinchus oxyrinchus TaxID=40147 RepID=A0AAD8CNX0_ACIOX|nr:hypothetical protein AOXY_G27545 [Acipenser oxyrinchus oxyrinchus]
MALGCCLCLAGLLLGQLDLAQGLQLPEQLIVLRGDSLVVKPVLGSFPSQHFHLVAWKREKFGQQPVRILIHQSEGNITHLSQPFSNRAGFDTESFTLTLRNITAADSGEYQLTLTLPDGSEHSATTRVAVYEPLSEPWISADVSSLLCSVVAGSAPRFSWLLDGAPVSNHSYTISSDGRNLSLSAAHPHPAKLCGEFICSAHNEIETRTVSYSSRGPHCTVQDRHHLALLWMLLIPVVMLAVGVCYCCFR